MKAKRKLFLFLFLIIVFAISACNLPFLGSEKTDETGGQPQTIVVVPGAEETEEAGGGLFESKNEPDPKPVGIQDGLGSLDSYKIQFNVKMTDEKGSKYRITNAVERSGVDKDSHSKTTIVTFDPEEDEEENKETVETYTVGSVTCTKNEDEWDYTEMTDQEKEMRDIFSSMMDFVPLIDDPKFVAEEEINGIKTNHFTFKVNGIGDSSGSVATVNQGDYWLAQDGSYIVRYILALEIRSAAEGTADAQVYNMDVSIELTDINIPVSISLPPDCRPDSSSQE